MTRDRARQLARPLAGSWLNPPTGRQRYQPTGTGSMNPIQPNLSRPQLSRRGLVRLGAAAATVAAMGAVRAATSPASAQAAGPIKIGILHSLSGTMAISETTLKDVMLMLIEKQNKAGGVLGRKLEAGRGRSGLELAAVRRESPPAHQCRQMRRDVRLLDLGVAQIRAAGVRGTEQHPVLSGAVRRPGMQPQRVLHRRGAEPAGDPGGRLPVDRRTR